MDDTSAQFPVGMRVLAVDDNATCLKLLETLLQKCGYDGLLCLVTLLPLWALSICGWKASLVTTTSKAVTALKLLREKDSEFNLVISDVHNMPDMDGLKLLEFVGLELDLPVIMLSADDDHDVVMKGITHGACDYLVKPVRLEEVKNIYQHVLRRKKLNQENLKKSQTDHITEPSCGKVRRKRKDENEMRDDNVQKQDVDPSRTRKRTRLNWSQELHFKFIKAIDHLGIEKAVPKNILELMNDENITREHVASHLQKYRLSLKKARNLANEKVKAALQASANSSYAQTGLLSGTGTAHLQSLGGPRNLRGVALRPFTSSSVLAQSNNNQISYAQGLNNPMFGQGVHNSANFSIPYRPHDLGTSFGGLYFQPCITRNQAWSCQSPIRGVCNEVWSSAAQLTQNLPNPFPLIDFSNQASSSVLYNLQEDSLTFPLPAGGDLRKTHCQATQTNKISQGTLDFIEQPRAEFLLLPPPETDEVQRSVSESDTEPKEHVNYLEKLQETNFLASKSPSHGSLEDLVNSILKS
ncbi:two-component response regulator ARR10-like [Punica granatum]|uniref:Two-component response regulator ARR10-like n=1 Tax=Punica granatum TaxID=22663 RepID=A0A6P8BT58_PUNGR|nr:two-component response regulator ARR10-like [Punica granatum]